MAGASEYGSEGYGLASSGVATIAGLDFNAAASDRIITAEISVRGDCTITGVTIGGETAAELIGVTRTLASPDLTAAIWAAAVPTGTSGDVVVTLSVTTTTSVSVSTHSLTGVSITPTDTDSASGSGANISITGLTIPIDGVGIVSFSNAATTAVTWTGAHEDHDTDVNTASNNHRHSAGTVTTVGTNTITADGATSSQVLVGVAFGPSTDDAADPESATVTTSTFSNTVDATKPSGTASGDLLVAFAYAQTVGANTLVPPGDWTTAQETDNISSEFEAGVYYKVAGGSEGSTYTFTATGAEEITVHIVRISGADTTTPVEASAESTAASAGNIVFPTVTSTTDDALILLCGFAGYATAPTTAQWPNAGPLATAVLSKDEGVADYGMIGGVANFIKATAGATGTTSAPNGTIGSDFYAVTLAIKAAGGGGGGATSRPVFSRPPRFIRRRAA